MNMTDSIPPHATEDTQQAIANSKRLKQKQLCIVIIVVGITLILLPSLKVLP